MFDECTHPTEDRLEGREPIGGLFRNIDEYFYAIRDSLLLCWENSSGQETGPRKAPDLLTSALIQILSRGSRSRRLSFSKHAFNDQLVDLILVKRPRGPAQPWY